jgi:hypothetical protein
MILNIGLPDADGRDLCQARRPWNERIGAHVVVLLRDS